MSCTFDCVAQQHGHGGSLKLKVQASTALLLCQLSLVSGRVGERRGSVGCDWPRPEGTARTDGARTHSTAAPFASVAPERFRLATAIAKASAASAAAVKRWSSSAMRKRNPVS